MSYPYESATPEQKAIGSLWWCIHHDIKLEPLTESIENRVRVIRETKAAHEQETRLGALRPVLGPLPTTLMQAYTAYQQAYAVWRQANAPYEQAGAAYEQAYAVWLQADAAWQQALNDHAAEIDVLFAVECADVPWGPDGLVFPEGKP